MQHYTFFSTYPYSEPTLKLETKLLTFPENSNIIFVRKVY